MSDTYPEGTTPPASDGATPPPPPAYGQPASPYGAQPPAAPAYSEQAPYGAAPAAQPYGAAPAAYGAAPGYAAYPAPAKTNTLAIVSLIASIAGFVIIPFVGSIVGAITGHIGLGQIKRTGEQGRGLALAGVIIGWVGLALAIIGTIIFIAFWGWLITSGVTYSS